MEVGDAAMSLPSGGDPRSFDGGGGSVVYSEIVQPGELLLGANMEEMRSAGDDSGLSDVVRYHKRKGSRRVSKQRDSGIEWAGAVEPTLMHSAAGHPRVNVDVANTPHELITPCPNPSGGSSLAGGADALSLLLAALDRDVEAASAADVRGRQPLPPGVQANTNLSYASAQSGPVYEYIPEDYKASHSAGGTYEYVTNDRSRTSTVERKQPPRHVDQRCSSAEDEEGCGNTEADSCPTQAPGYYVHQRDSIVDDSDSLDHINLRNLATPAKRGYAAGLDTPTLNENDGESVFDMGAPFAEESRGPVNTAQRDSSPAEGSGSDAPRQEATAANTIDGYKVFMSGDAAAVSPEPALGTYSSADTVDQILAQAKSSGNATSSVLPATRNDPTTAESGNVYENAGMDLPDHDADFASSPLEDPGDGYESVAAAMASRKASSMGIREPTGQSPKLAGRDFQLQQFRPDDDWGRLYVEPLPPHDGVASVKTEDASKTPQPDLIQLEQAGDSLPMPLSYQVSPDGRKRILTGTQKAFGEQDESTAVKATVLDAHSMSNFSIRATLGGNVDLSWHHVTVVLPKDDKAKRPHDKVILDDINGRIEAGNLMALMGASGAGKTTFLNMVSGRTASVLQVKGTLAVNGHAVSADNIRKFAGYIQQQDVFLPNLTVREHLLIQAMLRMDNRVAADEREEHVDSVMNELGLTKIADTRIGSPTVGARGISGGEAKRLAFASEILTDPALLFADEPTSGLDSFAAQSVIKSLTDLVNNGRTVICTIHQPPSEVFALFNKLLLFAEGRTAYLGNVSRAPGVFERLGYPCPPNYNHADFYIHTLAIMPGQEGECRERVKEITDAYKAEEEATGATQPPEKESKNLANRLKELSRYRGEPWYTQFHYIMWRSWLTAVREFQVVYVQLVQTIVMALLFSLVFLQIGSGNDQKRAQNTSGALMMVLVSTTFQTLYPVVQVLPFEVITLVRDHDNQMYKMWVFFFCKLVADTPIQLLYLSFYCVITYFMFGLQIDPANFFIYFGVIALVAITARALGFLLSAIAFDNGELALAMVTPAGVTLMLFSGVFINNDAVPKFLIWLQFISPFKYSFESLMINEFSNRTLGACNGTMNICYETGEQILATLSLGKDSDQIVENTGVMVGLILAMIIAAFVVMALRLRFVQR